MGLEEGELLSVEALDLLLGLLAVLDVGDEAGEDRVVREGDVRLALDLGPRLERLTPVDDGRELARTPRKLERHSHEARTVVVASSGESSD